MSFTLAVPYQINKYKYLMSQPFSFTHSACFNSISSHSSNPEYINTKIKMPFCPRVWHLARLGHTQPMAYHSSCCWDCSERPEHRTASAAKHCFVLWKFFVEETGEQTGGMECYFIYWKQITLSLILQAFFAEEKKKSLLYFKIFSMVYSEI